MCTHISSLIWLVGLINTLASMISETEWVRVGEIFPIVALLGTLMLFVVLLVWALELYGKMCNPNGKLAVACGCATLTILFYFMTSPIIFDHDYDLGFAPKTSTLKLLYTFIPSAVYGLLILILIGGIGSLRRIISLPSTLQGILPLFECAKVGLP